MLMMMMATLRQVPVKRPSDGEEAPMMSDDSADGTPVTSTPAMSGWLYTRCNRLRCPLARMSGLQCFNMGHNGHGINLYGVNVTLMGN